MVDEEEEREIEGVDEENRRGERGGKRRLLPSDVFNLLVIPSAPAHRSQSSQAFYARLPGSPLSPNHLHPFPALLPTPILNMSDSSSSWATSSALVHTTSNIYRSRCTYLYPPPAPSLSSLSPLIDICRPAHVRATHHFDGSTAGLQTTSPYAVRVPTDASSRHERTSTFPRPLSYRSSLPSILIRYLSLEIHPILFSLSRLCTIYDPLIPKTIS